MSTSPDPDGSRALVLGGGGLLGAMYEIGILAAIERETRIEALDAGLIVGTSGGSVVAALFAAGYSPGEQLSLAARFRASDLCRLDFLRLAAASGRLAYKILGRLGTGLISGRPSLYETLAVLQEAVPASLLSLEPLSRFISARLRERGIEDSFEALPRSLLIPAFDLDTGERVVFGDAGSSDVPVSVAVAASCAIPRFFQPVGVGGRDFIDGGIADALNLDVALSRGARNVLAINPLVAPLNDRDERCLPSAAERCGRIAEQGLVVSLGQAIKIGHMHSTERSLQLHRLTHPEARIQMVQPDRLQVELDNPMDFSGRDRLLARGLLDGERAAREMSSRTSP